MSLFYNADPLLVVIIIFTLSLIGAVVSFKILKSTAVIKKPWGAAGGGIAGFLIFGIKYFRA